MQGHLFQDQASPGPLESSPAKWNPRGHFPQVPPSLRGGKVLQVYIYLPGIFTILFFLNLFLKKVLLHLFYTLMICMEKLKIEIFLNSSDYCQEYDFQNEFSQVAKLLYG